MRYLIIGAGGVGGQLAARLHAAGRSVQLLARGAHADIMRQSGLRVRTPDGTEVIDVPVIDSLDGVALSDDDAVVLAVKSQDTVAALDSLRAATAAEPAIVCAQNGVANEDSAARRFERVYGAMVWTPAVHLEPGEVSVYASPTGALFVVGAYPSGVDDVVTSLVEDWTVPGIAARADETIMATKYGKLMTNLGNAVDAMCGGRNATRAFNKRLRAEAEAVMAAAGIDYVPLRELAASCSDGISEFRPIGDETRPGGSSWQSLGRATGTIEADFLNGEIARLGAKHGVPTPLNRRVQRRAGAAARAKAAPGSISLEELDSTR